MKSAASARGVQAWAPGRLGLMALWFACGLPVGTAAQAVADQASPEAPATEESKSPIITPDLFKPGLFDNPYAFPDFALDRKLLPELNTRFLTIIPDLELIFDWSGFRQDATNVGQVGAQSNGFEVRSASSDISGEIGQKRLLSYKIGLEYNGFDVNSKGNFTISDFAVSFRIPKLRAKVSVGQMREDFGYEVIASTASMSQSERTLSPFSSPVNAGVKVIHQFGHDDRMTLTYGLFKNSWGDGDGKIEFSGRLTGLVIDQPGQRRFLHLGVSVREFGSDGTLSYKGTPGSHIADDFVDTGQFAASGATHIGLEVQYADGPWSILAEHATAYVRSDATGNPRFNAFYVLGSWTLTGESRPYDRTQGITRRIVPKGRWGAIEFVGRYSKVDLDGGSVRGGRYDRIEIGGNWWATTRWKLGLLAGRVWLDRFGVQGRSDTLLTRVQWVY